MDNRFFERPILNSPYEYPGSHWELDEEGQPTQQIIESRRRAEFITPIPKPKKQKGSSKHAQTQMGLDDKGISTEEQQYEHTAIINSLREQVDRWRNLPDVYSWRVTPETARLLQYWRGYQFNNIRPFFCQVEAVETVIWLTEVAPNLGKVGKDFLDHLANANHEANPELDRLALKMATGAGKTTVMAMLIAWQTINAVRRPQSSRFTRGFLVVTPGLTIRDRLRVLQPNDPDSYYKSRELVPGDMLGDLDRAKIVITNYHAFMLRERMELSKGGRSLLQGRGEAPETKETETIGGWLDDRSNEGVVPHEIGIFVRSSEEFERAKQAVGEAGLPFKILDRHVETARGHVSVSTMHLAKGLEFRAVVVMACDDEVIPLQERIETVADDSDLEEVYNTERHLLYVACTRARDYLLVTATDPASEFLDDLRG